MTGDPTGGRPWHVRVPREEGRRTLIERGEGGAHELELQRLRLGEGQRQELHFPGCEAAVVLLDGAVEFLADGTVHRASRSDPFSGPASALYLPPDATATVRATASDCELLAATTPCRTPGSIRFVAPDQVEVVDRGADGYRREVHNIFVDDDVAQRLLVGETFNPPGSWSSFPPHKHDGENGEPYLEEVYYYRTDPRQGFGFQGLYANDGTLDGAARVLDGDAALLQRGYHPVAAAPGYRLYYFWALAGERRKLVVFEDEAHAWIGR